MARKKNIYKSILYQAKTKGLVVSKEKNERVEYNLILVDNVELRVFHWTFFKNDIENNQIDLYAIYPGINGRITEPLNNEDLEKVYSSIKKYND